MSWVLSISCIKLSAHFLNATLPYNSPDYLFHWTVPVFNIVWACVYISWAIYCHWLKLLKFMFHVIVLRHRECHKLCFWLGWKRRSVSHFTGGWKESEDPFVPIKQQPILLYLYITITCSKDWNDSHFLGEPVVFSEARFCKPQWLPLKSLHPVNR